MLDAIERFSAQYDLSPDMVLLFGVTLGALLVIWSITSALTQKNPAAERIAALSGSRREARLDKGILKAPEETPGKFMKAFVPADVSKRSELRRKLAQAGYAGPSAMRNFLLVRIILGLVLPAILLVLIVFSKTPGVSLPLGVGQWVAGLSNMQVFQILSVLIGVGYFGPLNWLNSRVAERKLRIEESFPNALDLMQISVESGMGFDAAMTRVGNELSEVSPDIAFEFLSVQRQVQAGRERSAAMQDMANRTGVETVRSFANVAQQSMQYGTSMSQALNTYADELRQYRETRAQEMANKLPVKMSAVLASLMLPALILLTVGPVVIRYIRYFAG